VHATDATNASRTMLFDIHTRRLGRRAAGALRIPARDAAGGARLRRRFRRRATGAARRPIPMRGIAGDQQAATIGQACFAARHAEVDLRHRLLRLLNTGSTPSPRATGC
jgi:glycerol kinase